MSDIRTIINERLQNIGERVHMDFRNRSGFAEKTDLQLTPLSLRRYYAEASFQTTIPIRPASFQKPVGIIDPHAIITEADRLGQIEITQFVEAFFESSMLFGEEKREVWKAKTSASLEKEINGFEKQQQLFLSGKRRGTSLLCDSLDGTLLFRVGATDFAIMLGRYEDSKITDLWVHYPARETNRTINAAVVERQIYIDNRRCFQAAAGELFPRSIGIHFIEKLNQRHKDFVRAQFSSALDVSIDKVVEEYHIGPGILNYAGASAKGGTSAVLLWSEGVTGDKDRNWSNKPWDTMPYHALTEAQGGKHGEALTGKPYSIASTDLYPAQPILFSRRPEFWTEVAGAVKKVRADLGIP